MYNHIHQVYGKLTIDYLSTWLDSSVGRALHRYRKVMGLGPLQACNFFRLFFQLLKLKAHCEDHNFSHVYPQFMFILIFIYMYNHIHQVYGKLTIDYLSTWLDSSVGRALHRYRKVMGLGPLQACNFFRLFFQLLKLKAHCEDHHFTLVYLQFDCSLTQLNYK